MSIICPSSTKLLSDPPVSIARTLQQLQNTQAQAGRRAEHLVRVNHTRKRLQNDLAAVFEETSGALDTILIPKVSSAGEVLRISEVIDSLTSRDSRVGLIASIESAKAIVDLKEVSRASPSVLVSVSERPSRLQHLLHV